MHVFRHPKFYEEYRKRAKEAQRNAKRQASSDKQQATEASSDKLKHQANHQAASVEYDPSHQAPSTELRGDRIVEKEFLYSHKVLQSSERGSEVG